MSARTVERFIRWLDAFSPTRPYLLGLFHLDTPLVRGTGHRLFDRDGNEYLDFLSQFGAVSFGYNNPELCDALISCAQNQVPAMVQPFTPVAAHDLASKLADITPGELAHTIFTNSGAETVEAAIKLARAKTGRRTILSTWNGFHGKTLGALSATGKQKYQKPFGAPVPGFEYVPYGDLDALEARFPQPDLPAAFLVEPIQGEGGVI
jgi:acetylornithine/succinyldiaminopimelate/putrescine aminotransferase